MALFDRRSSLGLFGKHVNIRSGRWSESVSGIGSNSDSFYEYLIKMYVLFEDEQWWWTFIEVYNAVVETAERGLGSIGGQNGKRHTPLSVGLVGRALPHRTLFFSFLKILFTRFIVVIEKCISPRSSRFVRASSPCDETYTVLRRRRVLVKSDGSALRISWRFGQACRSVVCSIKIVTNQFSSLVSFFLGFVVVSLFFFIFLVAATDGHSVDALSLCNERQILMGGSSKRRGP